MKQKNSKWLFSFVSMAVVLAFTTGCGEEGTTPETSDLVPVVTTTAQSNVAQTTATCGGTVTSDGGSAVTAKGVCYGTTAAPTLTNSKTTDGTGTGFFSSSLTGLTANTTYYVRAYATNANGTAYGAQISFETLETSGGGDITYGSMSDCDGNTYKTVVIGTQTWMAENLKTTKYNDETAIPLVEDKATWAALRTPGYCWYNNDAAANKSTHGALYNWYAVGIGNLAPTGWHVPTSTEWATLMTYLRAVDVADTRYSLNLSTFADVAKAMSLSAGWVSNAVAGSPGNSDYPLYVNKTGFSATPSGERSNLGTLGFSDMSYTGMWWTATNCGTGPVVENLAYGYYINYNTVGMPINTPNKFWGVSVRCIKD